MSGENRLKPVAEGDLNKANGSITSINTGLSSTEQAAGGWAKEWTLGAAKHAGHIEIRELGHQ